jgi:hypothetical protein
MNILTHQLLEIEARFGIAYRIPRLGSGSPPLPETGPKISLNDAPRLNRGDGVRIELDCLLTASFTIARSWLSVIPRTLPTSTPGDFDRRTGLSEALLNCASTS